MIACAAEAFSLVFFFVNTELELGQRDDSDMVKCCKFARLTTAVAMATRIVLNKQ